MGTATEDPQVLPCGPLLCSLVVLLPLVLYRVLMVVHSMLLLLLQYGVDHQEDLLIVVLQDYTDSMDRHHMGLALMVIRGLQFMVNLQLPMMDHQHIFLLEVRATQEAQVLPEVQVVLEVRLYQEAVALLLNNLVDNI